MSKSRDLLFSGNKLSFRVDNANGKAVLELGNNRFEWTLQELAKGRLLITSENGQHRARVARDKDRIWVWLEGRVFDFRLPATDHDGAFGAAEKHDDVRAPMPGTLIKLLVAAGDAVTEGQMVAVVEAMKMEHPLRAPRAGIVDAVFGVAGAIVDAGAVIVSLAREE